MPTEVSEDMIRNQLRSAFEADTAERRAIDNAHELSAQVAQAATVLGYAKSSLATFEGLDEEITEWRVQNLKSGRTAALSPDLIERRIEKAAAVEELEQATAVHDLLKAELEAATKKLGATDKVRGAVVDVVSHEVDNFIVQLEEVKNKRHRLRFLLMGLQNSPTTARLHGLQARISQATNDPDMSLPSNAQQLPGAKSFWQAFETALLTDPDAAIGELPTLEQILYLQPSGQLGR